MKIEDIIEKQTSEEHQEYYDHWVFLRSAINRKLKGKVAMDEERLPKYAQIIPQLRKKPPTKSEQDTTYLVRQPIESRKSYFNRNILAVDGGESGKVLREYVGHISRGGYEINEQSVTPQFMQSLDNMDGDGTQFKDFLNECAWELMGMGKCYVLTLPHPEGHPMAGQPYSKIIPREYVIDYAQDDGVFRFIKFRKPWCYYGGVDGLERIEVEKTVLITPEKFITAWPDDKGKMRIQSEEPNALGFVPVAEAWLGHGAASIVDSVATLQFVLMNAESVLSQKIRLQALNILAVPDGPDIDSQLSALTAQTYLRVPQGAYNPQWVAYPATGLDGDFKYIEWCIKRVYDLASLRYKENTQNVSGYSKQWDFLDTDAVLQVAATALEAVTNQTLQFRAMIMNMANPEKAFTMKRKFDPQNLLETLQIILQAIGIGIGDTAEKKARMVARDSLKAVGVQLTPEELEKSNAEIMDESEEKKLMQDITQAATDPIGHAQAEGET